jgi:uncharacterized membrane protein SirB2
MYTILKMLHVTAAALSISGFTLRGYWMLRDSGWLNRTIVRVLPHLVDTVLLASGVGLVLLLNFPVLDQPWMLAKLAAIFAYILLGTVALKRGRTRSMRITAMLLAMATFAYIVGVALSKSASSWLAML